MNLDDIMYLLDNNVNRCWKSSKFHQVPASISICAVYLTSSALLAGSTNGELHIFSIETLEKLPALKLHENTIFGILASHSLDWIITAGRDNKIMVTRRLAPDSCEVLAKVDSALYGFAFCPFSSDLIFSTKSKTLTMLNVQSKAKTEIMTHQSLSLLATSKRFRYVAAAGNKPSIFLMRTEVLKIETLDLKDEIVAHFEFASDEALLVASTMCGRLMIIDSFTRQILKKAHLMCSEVRHFGLGDGRIFAVSSECLKILDFDLKVKKTSEFFNPRFVLVTHDNNFLVVVENWKIVKKIDIFTGEQTKAWAQDCQETCRWTGSGFYVGAGEDLLLRVWDSSKSTLLHVFGHNRQAIRSVSMRGQVLVTCNRVPCFYVIDLKNNRKYLKKSKLSILLMLRNRRIQLV